MVLSDESSPEVVSATVNPPMFLPTEGQADNTYGVADIDCVHALWSVSVDITVKNPLLVHSSFAAIRTRDGGVMCGEPNEGEKAGQWDLPGGKREESDVETAQQTQCSVEFETVRRESQEEIGFQFNRSTPCSVIGTVLKHPRTKAEHRCSVFTFEAEANVLGNSDSYMPPTPQSALSDFRSRPLQEIWGNPTLL